MYQICKLPYYINIGKTGSNLYREIVINCKDWFDKYPDAEISATFIRPGGTTMSPELEIDGTKRIWKPTAEETMYAGTGYLEIEMTAEEVVGKSVTVEIIIEEDVTGSPVTPAPTPPGGGGGGSGADGFSPTITVTAITGGHRVTITDVNGTRYFDVLDGVNGADGAQGPTGPQGAAGEDGEDGVSPTVAVTEITGGHRVTITDADGTHVFDVMDGEQGEQGADGAPGADGYSPTVTVTEIAGGHRVTITDVNGTRYFDVMDGADGAQGAAEDNVHYHSTLKNAVDDANADFENDETATKTNAICKLTKLLNGDYVIDCLDDATITEVLKPSVTMRINTNGHAITVNNNGGQIISTTGNTDKIFDFVFDATGSTVTITGGSNANTQVFGWMFGDIESKTLKNASGNVSWYDTVSAFPAASSNNGKYAFLIKRDDTDLVEFAEIYKSNGTAWEVFSADSPHGKLSVIGGTYVVNCSGIATYFIRLSFARVSLENINVTVTNTHTESYSGTAPDGILKLVMLYCSTADIKNSTLNSYYTGNVDMSTRGIDMKVCSVASMDNVHMICDAPYHNDGGNSYTTHCCAVGRACFAYVRNCKLISMHSAIDNAGNCFVDGGTHESISHGGIYATGRGVIIVQNAHIGAGTYTGLGDLQYGMCAFTLGWEPTDKPTCYLHNCTLEAPSAKGFIVFRTAANANLYMSKTNIPANKMIRVDYVNAVGDAFEDMTDAEKPVIHVGNDCNVTLDMLACRTRAGNSKVEPPIKTQFTTTDAGKILFDSVNTASDEESIADADAIKNSLVISNLLYGFAFLPFEWKKIVGSLKTIESVQSSTITDAGGYFTVDTVEGALQSLGAELAGINALVGGGL